jgi:hypothetical protein
MLLMNKPTHEQRSQAVNCLIEGCCIRATVRMTGIAEKTVMRLLREVGEVYESYQDRALRNLPCRRIQLDELWGFNYCKAKDVTLACLYKIDRYPRYNNLPSSRGMLTSNEMAKRTPKNETKEMTAQVKLIVKLDTPSYYVNYVAVSHTAYDFTLSVAKIPSPLPEELTALIKNGKPMPLEPILQLIVPPLLVDGLIRAFLDQKQKYEKTLAQQVKNNEIQHQHTKLPGRVQ